jgi:flavin-dependent dehydrogenase
MATETAGPGYFLVGDAAAVRDPAASHGTLKALMSGMLAGHLITQVFHAHMPKQEASHAYQTRLSSWFHFDVSHMRAIYRNLFPVTLKPELID